jgi:hypothetical protein
LGFGEFLPTGHNFGVIFSQEGDKVSELGGEGGELVLWGAEALGGISGVRHSISSMSRIRRGRRAASCRV